MRYFSLFIFTTTCFFNVFSQEDHKQFNIIIETQDDKVGVIYEENTLSEKYKSIDKRHTVSVDTFLLWLFSDQDAIENKNDVLLHIHGMWGGRRTNFNKAYKLMHRFYVEHEHSDLSQIVSIKWPGNDFEYRDNKATIEDIKQYSKKVMVEFLQKYYLFQHFFRRSNKRMDLIAHSLGNQFFEQAYNLFTEEEKSAIWFDQIVLAASDNDSDVFDEGNGFEDLPLIANGVHVYYSDRDLTLGVSNRLNDIDRLGQAGPSNTNFKYENLYFIDVTSIKDEVNIPDLMTGHAYYRASPDVTYDILYALMSMKNLQRIQGKGGPQFYLLE